MPFDIRLACSCVGSKIGKVLRHTACGAVSGGPKKSGFPKMRRGSIGLEAALSMPALLILFGSVAQFMVLAQSRMYVEQAAYAAARSAMVHKCPQFDLIGAFKSPIAGLASYQCQDNPAKWENAARWALVPASASSEYSSARGACPQIPAGKEILLADGTLSGISNAVENSLCYAFEPDNVEVQVEWVATGINQYLPDTSTPIRATVRFKYPLSTPFRRFIYDGKRADGTYWKWGEATVVLL